MCQARPSNPNREARLFVRKRETDERVKRCRPKPDVLKLGELPDKLEEGYISIPHFQRQFVWDIDDCAKLLDSVFKGYPVGTVDGSYGDQTQIAVSFFYEAIRQRERNYITPSMYRKLFASDAPYYDPYMPLQKGDQGLRVRMVQQMLRKNGFDPQKIDGVYGALTVKAMEDYQKSIGYVPPTGEVYGEYAARSVLEKLLGTDPQPVTRTDL